MALDRYDLSEHQVWALSSALALVGLFVMIAAMVRTPEYRTGWRAEIEADWTARSRWLVVAEGVAYVVFMIALVLTPIVIMLGVAPDLDAALSFTYVVLILLGARWTLLSMVFAERSPASA